MDTPRTKLPVLARLTAFLPWMCANSEEVLAAPEDPANNRGTADKMLSQVRILTEHCRLSRLLWPPAMCLPVTKYALADAYDVPELNNTRTPRLFPSAARPSCE